MFYKLICYKFCKDILIEKKKEKSSPDSYRDYPFTGIDSKGKRKNWLLFSGISGQFWRKERFKNIFFFSPENFYLCSPKKYLMANHSATRKSVRKTTQRNERNRYQGKTTRNAIRDFKAIDTKAAALEGLPQLTSKIDKLAKSGIIHKNKASNLKSKLAKKIHSLGK
jgi:small subunit ribosomal protein S20